MRETADESFQRGRVEALPFTGNLGLVVCGPDGVRSVPIDVDRELVIGRHESCHLSLPVPALSRYHARFSRQAGIVTVEDLGSRHGTWVGGERIAKAELGVGASVRLADVVVAVTLQPRALLVATRVSNGEALYLSPRMLEIRQLLHRIAQTELSVVVLGETGTGKELAARELHQASLRKHAPLRVLNCAAIPTHLIEGTLFGHERGAFTGAERARPGVFEEANGGTLFLDEVGELSHAAQAALLRVLESRRLTRVGSNREIPVDVRIVAATHRDLHAMAARGEFRSDILHRLCVVTVELPPLRSRREEIAPLARHFLSHGVGAKEIDAAALARLEERDWPGNVRELRNVLASAALLAKGPCITESDIPESTRPPVHAAAESRLQYSDAGAESRLQYSDAGAESQLHDSGAGALTSEPLRTRLKSVERAELQKALEATHGNQRRAAALLGVPLRTFERRLRAWRQSSNV
jgi:two-component system response regulator AtoC